MKASKGVVFNCSGDTTIMICVSGLPESWISGNTYLSLEQAEELRNKLDKAINSNTKLIFE